MAIRAEGTLKQVIDHANRIERRTNIKGTVTLTPNATATTVTVLQAGFDACAILSPSSANAAVELASGGCFISTYGAGTFTITHRNLATSDRTFRYMVAV